MSGLQVVMPFTNVAGAQKPIAPKPKALKNSTNTSSTTGTECVSSSTGPTGRGSKRKLTFHPTLGYAIPPPVPAKVARRNARERNRVKQVNGGFEMLRSHIPSAAKHKKMSKVDTLRHAVEYIQSLQRMISEEVGVVKSEPQECVTTPATPTSPSPPSSAVKTSPKTNSSDHHVSSSHQPPPPLSLMQPPQQHQTHQQQYSVPEQVYNTPLTPRTPNTPNLDYVANPFTSSNESGYETSSYYSMGSGMISPRNAMHHQPTAPHPNQYSPLVREDSASPSSPSVYSEGSGGSYQPLTNLYNSQVPMAYYENSEEDELLDTIVSWQDQN